MLFIRKGTGLNNYGIVRKDNIGEWAYYMIELPNTLIRKLKLQGVSLEAGNYMVATCPTVWKNAEPSANVFTAPVGENFVELLNRSTSNCFIINNIADVDTLMACGEYSMKLRDAVGANIFHVIYNVGLMTSGMLLDEVFFQYFDKHSSVFTFALGNNIVKGDNLDTHVIHNLDIIQWVGASFPTMIGVNSAIRDKVMHERYLVSEDCLFHLDDE